MVFMSNGYAKNKFLCDTTVGKLAKLLRMIGLDTEMCQSHQPGDVIEVSLNQERTILTRNTAIAEMKLARNILLIYEYEPYDQFRTVLKQFRIEIERDKLLTRCMVDNAVLDTVSKEDIKGRVWPYVYETQDDFKKCPKCGRIYWPATHVNAMIDKLKDEKLL